MDTNELRNIADRFLKEDTNPSEKVLFQSSSYDDLQSMNIPRIHTFITGMEQFGNVLVVIELQDAAKVMACVWGPVRFLLEFANSTDGVMDNLLGAYEKIGDNLPLLSNYVQLFVAIPNCAAILVDIYQDILTFHRLIYKLFSQTPTLFQKIYEPTWKGLNNNFDHLAGSLKIHGDFMNNIRNASDTSDDTQKWKRIRKEFLQHSKRVKIYQDAFTEKESIEKRNMKEEILAWISASDKTQLLHKKFQDTRICPDTCRWLFKSYRKVSDWMAKDPPPDSAIWLQGSMGFGKTILASLLIDELEDLRTEKSKHTIPRDSKVCYFCCQNDEPDHCTYLDTLKGVLHQMVESTEYLLQFCMKTVHLTRNLTRITTAEALIEAFFEYNTRQYVIIDGLDACETAEIPKIAKFFMGQVTKCDSDTKRGRLRVLFVSQPIPDITKAGIMPDDAACVQLKETDNAADIRSYVKERILDFPKRRLKSSGFSLYESDEEQIESYICGLSGDMFLYAYLAIEYLLRQKTEKELRATMKEEMAPKDLSQIYGKLLGIVQIEPLKLAEGEAHCDIAM